MSNRHDVKFKESRFMKWVRDNNSGEEPLLVIFINTLFFIVFAIIGVAIYLLNPTFIGGLIGIIFTIGGFVIFKRIDKSSNEDHRSSYRD